MTRSVVDAGSNLRAALSTRQASCYVDDRMQWGAQSMAQRWLIGEVSRFV